MCAGWRGWFGAPKRSVDPGRADKWSGIRDLSKAGAQSRAKGLGFPSGGSQWNALLMSEPRQNAPSGCSGLEGVLGRDFREQNGHQLPLCCFVNLSLETQVLDLCLDFYWPDQAIT